LGLQGIPVPTFFPYQDSVQDMKELVRIREGKMLGGVCGGIGKYFDIDPVLIRILWVVLTCLSVGIGAIVYIAAWILMPEEEEKSTVTADTPVS